MSSILFWLTVYCAPISQEHYVIQTSKNCLTLRTQQVPTHPKMEPTKHTIRRKAYIMVAPPVAFFTTMTSEQVAASKKKPFLVFLKQIVLKKQ